MYTVTILEKSKKTLRTYQGIVKVMYFDLVDDIVLEGDAILTHTFPTDMDLHFYSATGNYTVSGDIIGTIEIEKEA